jgi:UDP-N-acetylglucosamine acyltransferase
MEATPERDEIIDFIRNSSRGVMKGYSGNSTPALPEGKGV